MSLRIAVFGQAPFGRDVTARIADEGHEIVAVHVPPDRGRPPQMPETASVQEGRIIVERWTKSGWSLAVGSVRLQIGG